MNPYRFEKLVVELLIKMGYGRGSATKKSRDGGIDGVVMSDKFGFDAVYTQAKRWTGTSSVQTPDIAEFLGSMTAQGATKGLFVTTAKFSKGAEDFVKKAITQKIVLVDGEKLAELMIEYGLGVTTVQNYEIKRIDSDYFNNDEE